METKEDDMLATVKRSDLEIQQDVMRELRWDTRIGPTEVGVEVDKGIVTLTGTVENFAKKHAATEAAHRLVGVLDVANDITVHLAGSPGKTDTEIARAVRHALEWDAFVPDRHIRSNVSEGWVTLEGDVEFLRECEDAARVVRRLGCVKGVWNQIMVKPKKVDPVALRKMIEEALERRAEREAETIGVTVDDGTVTLSGKVRSWLEKDAVVGAIGHAPGVRTVNDKLRIEPWN
ncbi:MAG: BON domain-containing protein [Acidobacteriota bacterium]|nr:BON domain-containing protein [Acidobacteriota bacterium]